MPNNYDSVQTDVCIEPQIWWEEFLGVIDTGGLRKGITLEYEGRLVKVIEQRSQQAGPRFGAGATDLA